MLQYNENEIMIFYFGSIGESGPGDCNKIFEINDAISRVRRLIGTAGLRTFKLDSTTTSSATIAPAAQEYTCKRKR